MIKSPNLKEKAIKSIVEIVNRYLKDETYIQIDSFLPIVDGKEINNFFSGMNCYAFPPEKIIDESKKYTVIV